MIAYQFKLYNHKRNRHLHRQIDIGREVYNHCIRLHRRYYRLTGKYLNANKLKKHLTELKKLPKYSHWCGLGSQAIQDQVERIDKAFKRFFSERKKGNKKIRPPRLKKKWYKQRSFTLKQAGYKVLDENYIRIGDSLTLVNRRICRLPLLIYQSQDSSLLYWEFDVTNGKSVFNPHRLRVRSYEVTVESEVPVEKEYW